MIEKKKVNLGCCIASQLRTAIDCNIPLTLGNIVIKIVLLEGLIDLARTKLHKAYEPLPLDLMSLDDTGLLCKNGSLFSI